MPFDNTTGFVRDEIVLLGKMAEILATPEKWCQGDYINCDTRAVCLVGALNVASGRLAHSVVPMGTRAFGLLIQMGNLGGWGTAHAFNDAPGTTHADVLDLIARTRRSFE